jgi:hypothetical protein
MERFDLSWVFVVFLRMVLGMRSVSQVCRGQRIKMEKGGYMAMAIFGQPDVRFHRGSRLFRSS